MTRKTIIVVLLIFITIIINLVPFFNAEVVLRTGKSLWLDLAQHFIYYFSLSLLIFYFFYPTRELPILTLIIAGATVLELAQALAPGVRFSYHDIVSNIAGSVAAYFVWLFIRQRIGIKKKPR